MRRRQTAVEDVRCVTKVGMCNGVRNGHAEKTKAGNAAWQAVELTMAFQSAVTSATYGIAFGKVHKKGEACCSPGAGSGP